MFNTKGPVRTNRDFMLCPTCPGMTRADGLLYGVTCDGCLTQWQFNHDARQLYARLLVCTVAAAHITRAMAVVHEYSHYGQVDAEEVVKLMRDGVVKLHCRSHGAPVVAIEPELKTDTHVSTPNLSSLLEGVLVEVSEVSEVSEAAEVQ